MGRRKSSRRSRASKRGWDTRIRRQGYRQVIKAVAKRNPTISSMAFAKDMVVSSYKMVYPRQYRRNRLAKSIEKYI